MSNTWINTNNVLYKLYLPEKNLKKIKVASFDLDDTIIIKTNKDIIEYVNPAIFEKFEELTNENYHIAIFSNQSNLDNDKIKKLKNIFKKISADLLRESNSHSFFISKLDDYCRKPNIGMWSLLEENISIDYKKSFFCGDAAGRIKPSKIKKQIHKTSKTGDFSDSDRKFALNIGITFYTPDFYYLGIDNEDFNLSGYDPELIPFICNYDFDFLNNDVIIMCGFPGSGKTTFYNEVLKQYDYDYYNSDDANYKFSISKLESSLKKNKNIVIDSLAFSLQKRKLIIDLIKKYDYQNITCITMTADLSYSLHLNNVRHLTTGQDKIPKIAYNVYKKNYTKPSKKEGFTRILNYDACLSEKVINDKEWMKAFKIRT